MGGGHHEALPEGPATRKEMSDAGLLIAYRDACAHLLIPLNKCAAASPGARPDFARAAARRGRGRSRGRARVAARRRAAADPFFAGRRGDAAFRVPSS